MKREIELLLNRHSVDLSHCQLNINGKNVKLTGRLKTINGDEYSTPQIEKMIQDFQCNFMGFTVNADFENWKFSTGLDPLGIGEFEDDDCDLEAA